MSFYNVNCSYVFKIDVLMLNNQLLCSFLGKTISLIVSIPWFLLVLCVELGMLEFPQPTLLHLLLFLFSSCSGGHVSETFGLYFQMFLEDKVLQKSSYSSGSYNFSAHFYNAL